MSIWNWWAFASACAWIFLSIVLSPVYAVIVLSPSGFGTGAGIGIHVNAVKKAQLRASGIKSRKNKRTRRISLKVITYLIKRVKIERIFLSGVVSFEDAMHTALAFAALNALSQIKPLHIQNETRADFALGRTNMEITGILSVTAGHIMIAALKHAAIALRERFDLWTNTRSKA
ncbi:MAG: hypothetical protein IKJ65_05730 [Clostridia bacterium]|nr:hypothetical protein [Clostridia bacterium]